MQRELVRLRDRYLGVSRATRCRWKRLPNFPEPVVIRGTEFFYVDELVNYEERNRKRRREQPAAAAAARKEAASAG